MTVQIELFGNIACDLGESPVWDARRGWLWWVDSRGNRIHAADRNGHLQREWTYEVAVGSIGLARDGLVVAFADHFALLDGDGVPHRLANPAIGTGAIRFNDGKADRQGRFLAGTMQHGGQEEALATLWRLDLDGSAKLLERGLKLANTICFSPCGRWLYLSDTLEAVIRRYPYNPENGAIGAMESFLDCATLGLAPDGATVDSEGRLWVAMVTTQEITCISPQGEVLRRIEVPLPYPSCPAFGGPDMTTLFVTTIANSGHKLLADHPEAGRLLAITGLDAAGIPEAIYVPDNHT